MPPRVPPSPPFRLTFPSRLVSSLLIKKICDAKRGRTRCQGEGGRGQGREGHRGKGPSTSQLKFASYGCCLRISVLRLPECSSRPGATLLERSDGADPSRPRWRRLPGRQDYMVRNLLRSSLSDSPGGGGDVVACNGGSSSAGTLRRGERRANGSRPLTRDKSLAPGLDLLIVRIHLSPKVRSTQRMNRIAGKR